ncbi:MAG: site-2 protease family protein [Planctomycetota bacterium]
MAGMKMNGGQARNGGLRSHAPGPRFGDPLSWSVPVLRLGGTIVRAHAVLLGTVVTILFRAGWFSGDSSFLLGPLPAAVFLASLCGCVFVHEWVTLLMARRLGGDMPEIVLQPLGGMETLVMPDHWRSALLISASGPLLTLLLAVTAMAGLVYGTDVAPSPDPFGFTGIYSPEIATSAWLESLYLFGVAAILVSGANLLPAPPFRGASMLEAVMLPRVGNARARRYTHRVGVVATVALGVIGILALNAVLVLVALLSAACLHREHRRLEAIADAVGGGVPEVVDLRLDALLDQQSAEADAESVRRLDERRIAAVDAAEAELDRILAKINTNGLASLDEQDRAVLDAATRRRRERPAPEDPGDSDR